LANPKTIARLEGLIHRRAAYCLQFELNDPRSGFVTVLRAELSKDLSVAKIFYSVLGDEADRARAARMLEHAGGFIQRQVGRVLHLRRVPHMKWIYDDSIVEAARLDELIQRARERDRTINPALTEGDAAVQPELPPEEEIWSRHAAEDADANEDAAFEDDEPEPEPS
jgi:ribosome-binding factor A